MCVGLVWLRRTALQTYLLRGGLRVNKGFIYQGGGEGGLVLEGVGVGG